MRLTSSEITTTAGEAKWQTGTPHGERGLVESAATGRAPLPLETANRGRERLRHLLPSVRGCSASREEAEMILPYLTQPSEPMWIMGRVATLLLPYYERETPQAVREMEAEDWADALREFPAWAITAAVRWWKGADNPKRHKRPMEGDIAARCHIEMDAVNAAKRLMAEPIWPTHRIPVRPEPPEPKVKAEDVAEILASLNAKVADNQMNKSRDQA